MFNLFNFLVKIYNLLTFVFQAPCLFHGLFTHSLFLFDGHEDPAVKTLAAVVSLADLESELFRFKNKNELC
jgi:hypothetical protein